MHVASQSDERKRKVVMVKRAWYMRARSATHIFIVHIHTYMNDMDSLVCTRYQVCGSIQDMEVTHTAELV